ncbi:spore germination protein [Rossellomorea aquimaris]|uniref:GerAB/ArcD/ProY family transporter n=1 Tax=Rossellomorea aquimaris TaxID=189382 RepID=UPI001CD1D5C2|nr:GerAB/ArcD/ProY family transporter [Rossellomorea aquimaris]MCA1053945.1 spore germination protein [Rossellomorea aquimaris]
MKINPEPQRTLLFNAFLVAFIIHTAQIGVGIAGVPRVAFMEVKQDAWITMILSGFVVSIVIFFMTKLLSVYAGADLFGIQFDVYGRWISTFLNSIYILYFLLVTYVIMMNYTEMVQAWIFPKMPTWLLVTFLVLLTGYAVLGGIRVVVGVTFIGILLTMWIVFMIYAPLKYLDINHLQPVFTASWKEHAMGIYKVSFSLIGFELLMIIYPYVKEKKNVLKYSLIGTWYSTFLFALVTAVSVGFFSEESLLKTIWPVLSMFKIVRIPNLERFEFIAVSFWMLVILPNLCIYFWAATRGVKRVFNLSQKRTIFFFGLVLIAGSFFIEDRLTMDLFTEKAGSVSFILSFVYPVILFLIIKLKHSITGKGAKG